MAFLDETGLAELWSLVKNADGKLQNAIDAGVKIAWGSYKGTGSAGQSNANTLTFDFEPKFLAIFSGTGNMYAGASMPFDDGTYESIPSYGCPAALTTEYQSNALFCSYYSGRVMYARKSADGKTVYWYHADNASSQLNSAQTYYYVAIG